MIISSCHSAFSLASINACMCCCAISLACSEPRLLTWHNQESTQWSPDPFSRERVGERVGSGHETNSTTDILYTYDPFLAVNTPCHCVLYNHLLLYFACGYVQ